MIKILLRKALAGTLAAVLVAPPWTAAAWAADAPESVRLEAIEVGDDKVLVHLSGRAEFTSFVTANPPRLVVELLDVEYQVSEKSFAGRGKLLKGVRSGQYQRAPRMVSRLVLDLVEPGGYQVARDGHRLSISLGAAGAAETAKAEAPAAKPEPAPAAKPEPAPAAKPEPAKAELAAEPAKPKRPAVSAPPPAPIKAAAPGEAAGMSTQFSPELETIARAGDATRSEPAAARPAPAAARSEPAAPAGPRGDIMSRLPRHSVSLDFDNTDIKDALRFFASMAKVNVIYGPEVSGSLTLHLEDVPFNEAFRTALTMMGLTTVQVGDNILRVLSPAALGRVQQTQAVATRVIPLNYAKATEIVNALNAVRGAEGRAGTAIAEAKTNSVIVTESLEGLVATERLIAQLDVRPKQVLIEAKLVEVNLNNALHYGIQWDHGFLERGSALGKQGLTAIGSPVGVTAPTPPLDGQAAVEGFTTAGGLGASGRGTGVSLPASSVFGAFTLGRVTNNYFLNATLTAAAAQGKVKVLSDPKIATVNNQPATINVTTQIPYVTSNVASTGVQTQTVQYVTTGIQLSVTPTINADGRISLDINPVVSQPSATQAASATGAPAVDSRDAKTTVLVRDGETIVIGGLINDSVSNTIAKIPILGDIPILGWLFKKKSVVRTRAELLIFVTPKILAD